MKKYDIKYIIKRVIIGVLIVLIVGFINKCSVKALPLPSVNDNNNTTIYYYYNNDIFTTPPNNKILVDTIHFSNGISINIYDNYYNGVITYYDPQNDIYSLYMLSYERLPEDFKNIVLNITENNTNSINNPTNVKVYGDDISNSRWMAFLSGQSRFLSFSFNSLSNLYNEVNFDSNRVSFTNYTIGAKQLNVIAGAGLSYSYFYNSSYYQDYYISYTNFDSVVINNVSQQTGIIEVPANFVRLDISDYPGVYFVPKNYSTVPTTQNSIDETVIPFNFYYKGNFSEGYFPLNNYNKIVFLPNSLLSRDEISFTSSWFPLQQVIDDTTYDYYAYIFENNDYATFSQHEDSLIYYDSRYFDYYLITDFFDYYQTIDIINKENQQEQIDVSITSSLKSLYKAGSQTHGTKYIGESISDSLKDIEIIKYFDFIKIPLDFLNNIMTSSTCSPIEIPIPFTGGNLTLPCISSLFNEKIPQIYTILVIIVNGLLVYRITIRNIDTLTDSLSSDDDKLEVVDL